MKSAFLLPRSPVAAILFLAGGTVLGASWEAVNAGLPLTIAGVTALTVDPSARSTIYARTSYGGLFKSTDSGARWKAISSVTGVSSLAVDPKNSSTLYAATSHGIVRSMDGAETWIGVDAGLPNSYFYAMAIDPITPSTLYASALYTGGVFKSTNRGASWTAVNSGLPMTIDGLAAYHVTALTVDPVNPTTVYAFNFNGGIFKSTDGAGSWKAIPSPGHEHECRSLTIDPLNPSTIYAVCSPSIAKSTDGGQTWTAFSTGIPSRASIMSLAIDSTTPSNIYLSYGGFSEGGWGIFKSGDAGQSWSVLNTGLPNYNVGSVVGVSPTAPPTVYAGYVDFNIGRGRLVKSVDGGKSWDAADAGLTYIGVRVLATDPRDASTLYTGIGEGYVFKSINSGANWTKLAQFWNDYGLVHSLLIDPTSQNILYAATTRATGCNAFDKLLFKSTDGGASWSDSVSPDFIGCSFIYSPPVMAIDPIDPDTLYLGDTDSCEGVEGRLRKSADGGATWSFRPGFGSRVTALLIDPTRPATLYAGLSEGVAKSTDGGASWNNLPGVEADVLAMDPTNPNRLYAAANDVGSLSSTGLRELFKSTDGGATWLSINAGLDGLIGMRFSVTALAIAPANPDVLYAATAGGGVYKSLDGGANWVKFNDGLTNLDVRALAVASGTSTLYAATLGGIFKIIDEASGRAGLRGRR